MPFTRASHLTPCDRQRLVQCIEDLNYALVRAVQSPELLVDKFGAGVFCKLWALFQKNQSYDLALEEFQRWQVSRKNEDIITPELKQLLDAGQGAVERSLGARRGAPCVEMGAGLEVSDEEQDVGAGIVTDIDARQSSEVMSTWNCSACLVENDKYDDKCQVCGEKVPRWTCPLCISESSSIVMCSCQHCKSPQPAMARLRRKLAMDPASAFARADLDGSKDLTFAEWQQAFGDEVISNEVLRRLFDEFDANGDGKVSLDEFRSGLGRDICTKTVVQELLADNFVCENKPKKADPQKVAKKLAAAKARERSLYLEMLKEELMIDEAVIDESLSECASQQANQCCSSATSVGKIKVYVANCDVRTPFRFKQSAPLQKLVDAYCKKEGIDQLDVTFAFQGKELKLSQTPQELNMPDPCTIFCIPDGCASQVPQIKFSETIEVDDMSESSSTTPNPYMVKAEVSAALSSKSPLQGRRMIKTGKGRGKGESSPNPATPSVSTMEIATNASTVTANTSTFTAGLHNAPNVEHVKKTETEFPEGCRVQIHSLPQVLSCYNGKSARVLSTNAVEKTGRYLCQIGVNGAIEQDYFLADNLQRLPGLPTNWRMQQMDGIPNSEEEVQVCEEEVNKTCWRIGALVALMPDIKTRTKEENAPVMAFWEGVERDVPMDRLLKGGWKLHKTMLYNDQTTTADLDPGKGEWLCIGAREVGKDVLLLAAMAKRQDVLRKTSKQNETHQANGAYWYCYHGKSFGFSKLPTVSLTAADTEDSDGEYRLSWHLNGNGGWRAGKAKNLSSSGSTTHEKLIFYSDCSNPASTVGAWGAGAFGASTAPAPGSFAFGGFGATTGAALSGGAVGASTGGVNDEGAPVALSTQSGHTHRYYCGRHLGRAAIPGSDGQCGPNNGPQCQSCVRFQARPVNPPTLAPFGSTKPPTAGPHFGATSATGFDGFFSAGRGLQSVGCIKSVDLDRKKVQVVVVQGPETLLSQVLVAAS
jgi:hypothetical protein